MLVDELEIELCDLSLGHTEDAPRTVRNAPELGHFKIDAPYLGNLINRGKILACLVVATL